MFSSHDSSFDFAPGAQTHGFIVQSSEPLSEIDGFAHVMRHEKSGARLLFLQNEDANKAFSIAFKTPPADDTGVFHILEHSVLCGSEKFPVKEPFVDLLKTSMQTFLNALTFPDKTMYPVASTNEQDLINLIDVYMDAVLHPAIYGKRAIFEQEGWHYELEGAEGEAIADAAAFEGETVAENGTPDKVAIEKDASGERLRYNGVVFNEMKGALSDPDSVLYHAVNRALFPDTCYAFESGGHPRAIPQLTYESYLDTHARHYRLDNSYIVLYGNLDANRILGFLDENYLSVFESRSEAAPNAIGVQEPRVALDETVRMETAPENAGVGLAYVVGQARDFERVLACDILLDALMGGNESPIKRAILDAGLGGDATAYLLDSQAQPVAMFQLRNANDGSAQPFMELVESEVRRLVRDGIPRDVLEASLAQMSFDLRERDRGMADGVPLAMNALAGWLYDDDMPTTYLRYEDALAHMRAGLEGRYFEDVLESLVCKSDHKALVELVPEKTEGDSEEAAELAAKLAQMDEVDKREIRDEMAALRVMQESPDAPEAVETLPRLRVSDIGPASPDPEMQVFAEGPIACLFHNVPTRKISYLYLYFGIDNLAWEDVPYLSVLGMLLSRLDTERHTAAELDVLMRLHLGSLRFFADAFVDDADPSRVSLKMTVATSALSEELEQMARIPREIWETTKFDDSDKIRDILVQRRIAMEQSFANEGHVRAMNRLSSYEFKSGVLKEAMGGVDFYRFLCDLIDNFDERFDALQSRLRDVCSRVFTKRDVVASFTGSKADREIFFHMAGDFGLPGEARIFDGKPSAPAFGEKIPEPVMKREAFIVPSDVCYVAKGSDVGALGAYAGEWQVLASALSFDYLWNEVRVKGGAYGVGFRRTPEGFGRFYSFRDPAVDPTLERFDAAGSWLASFDPSEEEMEGYIVSTVASHDAPAKPRQVARRQDAQFFCEKPAGYRERLRAEKLATTPEKLRACSTALDEVAQRGSICVFGGEDVVRASAGEFNVIELM
ncbi:insulinase family protein [Slackia sp.]|uniref:insulinase family protein n=1 Tax=Slackia sp. TaxID=2049041 RepID=UPI002E76AB39|nr:insulinase family protein [Slackia sp.]MEE0518796.1 insulinase family protein [Slackia sp.]